MSSNSTFSVSKFVQYICYISYLLLRFFIAFSTSHISTVCETALYNREIFLEANPILGLVEVKILCYPIGIQYWYPIYKSCKYTMIIHLRRNVLAILSYFLLNKYWNIFLNCLLSPQHRSTFLSLYHCFQSLFHVWFLLSHFKFYSLPMECLNSEFKFLLFSISFKLYRLQHLIYTALRKQGPLLLKIGFYLLQFWFTVFVVPIST